MAKKQPKRTADARARAKVQFLDHFANNVSSMAASAAHANRSTQTIWKYRRDDPIFDEAVDGAKDAQAKLRVEAIEDSLFARIIKGTAAPALEIFYLKANSKKYRVADQQIHKHSGVLDLVERRRAEDEELENFKNGLDNGENAK